MKRINNLIKAIDIFGEPISFNINKKGETHKTLFGGILSFLYFAVFSTLFILGCIKL